MAYVRKVKTASGATAVQIVEKRHGVRRIVAHVGSAHDEAELAVLMTSARDRIHAVNRLSIDGLQSFGRVAKVFEIAVEDARLFAGLEHTKRFAGVKAERLGNEDTFAGSSGSHDCLLV